MEWTPLPTASRCAVLAVSKTPREERGVHSIAYARRTPTSRNAARYGGSIRIRAQALWVGKHAPHEAVRSAAALVLRLDRQ